MRLTPLLALTSLLLGCGVVVADERSRIQEEIKPFISSFYFEWEKVTGVPHPASDIKVIFVDEVSGKGIVKENIATCTYSAMTLRIERKWWNEHSVLQKEALVFHELGHCILLRRHITLTFQCKEQPSGCPVSIMYPSVLKSVTYSKYRTYYLQELFNVR